MKISIPRRENIPNLSFEDPARWYYKLLIGNVYRRRLEMVLSLMGPERKDSVLEIGYGSGLLLLELNRRFKNVFATDKHLKGDLIKKMLEKENAKSMLTTANLSQLPYKAETFDCSVCMSVLEHVDDLGQCISEIVRVTKENGQVIIGIPGDNPLLTAVFFLLGFKIHDYHKSNPKQVIEAINKKLIIEKIIRLPSFLNLDLAFYVALSCRNKQL